MDNCIVFALREHQKLILKEIIKNLNEMYRIRSSDNQYTHNKVKEIIIQTLKGGRDE